jgi:hypothetical protein
MTRSTSLTLPLILLTLAAAACSGDEPRTDARPTAKEAPPQPEGLPLPAEQASIDAIRRAVAAWRESPSTDRLDAVVAAAESASAHPDPPRELDLVLGDALANVVLRPELGIPRLERVGAATDPEGRDAWLDAWLRADAKRFSRELAAITGVEVDPLNPTIAVLTTRAGSDPSLGWRDVRDAWGATSLLEESGRHPVFAIDEQVQSVGALVEALSMLLPGWTLEVVAARSTLPSDADPLTTPGVVPLDADRRRMVAYTRSEEREDVRAVGTALDLRRPPRVAVLIASAEVPEGGRLFLALEGRYEDGGYEVLHATDPARAVAWFQASNDLIEARSKLRADDETAEHLRETYRERLLTGSR